jgi:two-component system nitrogen regulation sensor histidine kinase GlnL
MKTPRAPNVSLERKILENLNTAVLLFGDDLRLAYINPAGEVLFAVSARHVLGVSASELIDCPDERVETRFRQALMTRHPFTEREVNISLVDGRTITVNCTVLPLHQFEKGVELLVELHQVDRQLRISREEHLISQHQATQALIRGLAHEIKNPLGGLRGAAQLLEQELPEKALREYTRIIIDEADRLQKLMDRMLGPNRMPKERRVNIHHVLEHVRGLMLAEYPAGPRIVRDYDPSIPELMADPDRLIQAFLNLVRNAIVAAGQDGVISLCSRVLRQFTIGNRRHKLVLRVAVEDDGPGIPQHLQERIFFPMVSGQSGGTGLGLPIAQELVNQHGGLIECESRPGRTQFFVYLPLETSHA